MAASRLIYALKLAYDGARFHGWQRQRGHATVQESLERALARAGAEVGVTGAGRTDAGVHASAQVASFGWRGPPPMLDAVAAGCSEGLRLLALVPAPPRFNARWSARGKRYVYRIGWGGERRPDALQLARAADLQRLEREMAEALASRDLSSFCERRPPRPMRLLAAEVRAPAEGVELHFVARAFGKHMVRNLVGAMLRSGRAPPHGLTLEEVLYPPSLDPFSDRRS